MAIVGSSPRSSLPFSPPWLEPKGPLSVPFIYSILAPFGDVFEAVHVFTGEYKCDYAGTGEYIASSSLVDECDDFKSCKCCSYNIWQRVRPATKNQEGTVLLFWVFAESQN